jgi:hypothetical protein
MKIQIKLCPVEFQQVFSTSRLGLYYITFKILVVAHQILITAIL